VFLNVLFYSLIAGISTIAGTLLIFYKSKWARHNSIHLMSFAAGVMLALAFIHLIPEALEIYNDKDSESLFIIVLIAFVIFSAMESLIRVHPWHDIEAENNQRHGALSILSIIGLAIHSTIDGIVIAVGFKAGFQLGIMTTIAVILHEVPEGIITTSILLHDMMKKSMAFWFSILVAIATPFGAIVSYFLISEVSQDILGILLAIAAGSLIYIAASDLIPETHKEEKKLNTVFLIVGIVVLYLIGSLLGH